MELTNETKILRDYLGKHTACEVENLESKIQLLYGLKAAVEMEENKIFKKNVILDKLVREDCEILDKICALYNVALTVLPDEPFGETTLINIDEKLFDNYVELVLQLTGKCEHRKLTNLERVEITRFLDWVTEEYGVIAYERYLDTEVLRHLLDTITDAFDNAKTWEKIRVIYERVHYELTQLGD